MKKPFTPKHVAMSAAIGFLILAPIVTFGLFALKGFPPFAEGQPEAILRWLYETTGLQSFLAGGLFAGALLSFRRRWGVFVWPYDFGRSVSVGAVIGALLHPFSTLIVRLLLQKPYSDFWIAGALLTGSLTGAILAALLFWRVSKNPIV